MADEIVGKPDGNGKLEAEKQKPKDLTLIITLSQETGQLKVQGPGNGGLYDEPICFWMLRKAERFIEATNMKTQQPRIISSEVRPRIKDIFRRR